MLRLAILVLAVASACPVALGILGGNAVSINDYPYNIALLSEGFYKCGGAILNSRWVITTAHCTQYLESTSYTVRIGSNYHANGGNLFRVDRYVQHPEYFYYSLGFNYALLHLDRDINFGDAAKPISYQAENATLTDGQMLEVSGWGAFEYVFPGNGLSLSPVLRAVTVPKMDGGTCQESLAEFNVKLTDHVFCAGYLGQSKGACRFDKGVPVVDSEGVLVGLFSHRGCNNPGIYDRIANVADWIGEYISE